MSSTIVATIPWRASAFNRMLRNLVRRARAWQRARRRADDERALLANMSDRELRDIGIDRGSIGAVVDGPWLRG